MLAWVVTLTSVKATAASQTFRELATVKKEWMEGWGL